MTFFVIIGFHLSLNSGFYSFVNNSSTTKINPNGLAHKSYDMAINNTFIVSAPTKEKKKFEWEETSCNCCQLSHRGWGIPSIDIAFVHTKTKTSAAR